MRLIHRPIDQWPGELTRNRSSSPFSATHHQTVQLLEREVRALTGTSATEVVIQVALREQDIRLDGQPKANARSMEHPGVIIAFETRKLGPLKFSCDRFHHWDDNLRAIALGMESLRRVERYGMGTGTEQYRGWQALPAGMALGPAKMTYEQAQTLLRELSGWVGDLDVDAAYRIAAKNVHPDAGGDPEQFQRLQEAKKLLS